MRWIAGGGGGVKYKKIKKFIPIGFLRYPSTWRCLNRSYPLSRSLSTATSQFSATNRPPTLLHIPHIKPHVKKVTKTTKPEKYVTGKGLAMALHQFSRLQFPNFYFLKNLRKKRELTFWNKCRDLRRGKNVLFWPNNFWRPFISAEAYAWSAWVA